MQQKAFILLVAGLALLARPAAAHCNYLIEKGDNLYDIAENNGFNETELMKLNPSITDPELIFEGDTLRLPCKGGDDEKGDSIFDLLQHRTDMSTLFAALASVGMLEDLQDGDLDATLFAPTDKAFEALLKQLKLTAAQLLNDTALVQDVLAYHVIPGDALDADDLKNGKSYSTMLKGKKLKIKKNDEGVFVLTVAGQEVPVKIADLEAGDAIVHVIDEVLLPLESEGGKAPAPSPSKPTTPTGDGCTYTVKEGDTLFDIAAKYDTTLEDLVALNKQIEDPELILPGDEIKLKEC